MAEVFEGIHLKIRIEQGVEWEQIFRVPCTSYEEFTALKQRLEDWLKEHNVEIVHCWRVSIHDLTAKNFDHSALWLIKHPIFQSTDGCGPMTQLDEWMRLWKKCNLPGSPPWPHLKTPSE